MPDYDIWIGAEQRGLPWERWEANTALEAAQEFLDDQGDEWAVDGCVTIYVQPVDKSGPAVEFCAFKSGGWRPVAALDGAPPTAPEPFPELSPRRRQVAYLLATGKERGEIAAELGCSVKTLDTHRTQVLRGLGVRNAVELCLLAVRRGYVVP